MYAYRCTVLILFGTSAIVAMQNEDTMTADTFKNILLSKDCTQIHTAFTKLWPAAPQENRTKVYLKWCPMKRELLVCGDEIPEHAKICAHMLRDFIVNDIVYPAIYNQANIGKAVLDIDQLVSLTNRGPGFGVFGSYSKKMGNDTAAQLQYVIYVARNQPLPKTLLKHNVTYNPGHLKQYIVETYHRKTDESYNTISPLSSMGHYKKPLIISAGVMAVLLGCYGLYKRQYTKTQEDSQSTEDQIETSIK